MHGAQPARKQLDTRLYFHQPHLGLSHCTEKRKEVEGLAVHDTTEAVRFLVAVRPIVFFLATLFKVLRFLAASHETATLPLAVSL